MKFEEFKSQINCQKAYPIYLFFGEESLFLSQGLKLITQTFITEPSINQVVLQSDNLNAYDIISSLQALPFLSEYRLTVVKEYYPKADDVKALAKYLTNPNPRGILLILNSKEHQALLKLNGVEVVECNKLDTMSLARRVKGKCLELGVEISLEVAKLLVDYCSCDSFRIELEVEKLCAYALDKKAITKEDVELLVTKDAESKIYKMTEHIAKRQFDLALSVINEMLSRGESPQGLMAYIYSYFRRLLHASISDKSDKELGVLFKTTDFMAKKIKEQSKSFKRRALKSAVDTLIESDFNYKSGKSSVDDEMWLSVFKIMIG